LREGRLHFLGDLLWGVIKCRDPWQGQIEFADLRGIDIDVDDSLPGGRRKKHPHHEGEKDS
jgi:hypothetical protein